MTFHIFFTVFLRRDLDNHLFVPKVTIKKASGLIPFNKDLLSNKNVVEVFIIFFD